MSTRWLLLFFGCLLLAVPTSVEAEGCDDPFGCEENRPDPCDPWLDDHCDSGGNCGCRDCDFDPYTYLFFCDCTGADGWVNCSISGGGTSCDKSERCYYT